MSGAISLELQFFLTSVLWGIILLIVYDVLRIFRRVVKHKWFFVAVEDLIFWVICGFLIFGMMYRQNNGIIRGFSIIGMTLGMVVYNQSLSDVMVKWISSLFLWIGKGIQKIIQILSKPFAYISRRIKRVVLWFKKKILEKRDKEESKEENHRKKSHMKKTEGRPYKKQRGKEVPNNGKLESGGLK